MNAELPRPIGLRPDDHRHHRSYAGTLGRLAEVCRPDPRREYHRSIFRQKGAHRVGDVLHHRQPGLGQVAGILRPRPLHRHIPHWRIRIAGVEQVGTVTTEDVEHDVEHVLRHPFEIDRALQSPVDPVHVLEEAQVLQALLVGALFLGDIQHDAGDTMDASRFVAHRHPGDVKATHSHRQRILDRFADHRTGSQTLAKPLHHIVDQASGQGHFVEKRADQLAARQREQLLERGVGFQATEASVLAHFDEVEGVWHVVEDLAVALFAFPQRDLGTAVLVVADLVAQSNSAAWPKKTRQVVAQRGGADMQVLDLDDAEQFRSHHQRKAPGPGAGELLPWFISASAASLDCSTNSRLLATLAARRIVDRVKDLVLRPKKSA